MKSEDYDWAGYYKKVYEREKKKNAMLSAQISEKEIENQLLQDHVNKITGSIFGKVYKIAKLPARVYHRLTIKSACPKSYEQDDSLQLEYQAELSNQKDPYNAWIRETENKNLNKYKEQWAFIENKAEQENRKLPEVKVLSYQEISQMNGFDGIYQDTLDQIYLFAEHTQYLDQNAVRAATCFFSEHKDAGLWYAQEDLQDLDGHRYKPWFKPVWSPDTLMGYFYFGSFFAIRISKVSSISLKDTEDVHEKIYDMCFKISENCSVGMTDFILYHKKTEKQVVARNTETQIFETTISGDYLKEEVFWGYEKKYCQIKQDKIQRQGYTSKCLQTKDPSIWTVVPELKQQEQGLVSVIIPSKDHPDILKQCLASFLRITQYQQTEFIIVDNGSSQENRKFIQNFLKEFSEYYQKRFAYVYQNMAFNFSKMCNMGVREAKGTYLLFLNDDIEVIEKDWLDIMVGQAMIAGTGAVGAKLWYPDQERIQHAGITNMHIGPSHKLVTFPDDRVYYFGYNSVPYNMIAVTGACLLVCKDIYKKAGGMKEDMAIAYNDVELCFSIYEKGYFNVQRNDAVLYHHESLSRGLDQEENNKWIRLLQEKEVLYNRHPSLRMRDPYYNDNLKDDSPEYITGYRYPYDRRLGTVEPKKIGKENLPRKQQGALMLTVERAGNQMKNYETEPEIILIEGWCYMLGADNCMYDRWVIFYEENQDIYYMFETYDKYRYDVEAILPKQKNIALSGFVARVLNEDLINGIYKIGILYQNKKTRELSYKESDKYLNVN